MATEKEYLDFIRNLDYNGVQNLWEDIKSISYDTEFWNPGKAMEYTILRAFELEGCRVKYPYIVRMEDTILEQIDGCVYANGLAVLTEFKNYDESKLVNIEPISKLRNQLLRRPSGVIGSVFSTSDFSDPAMILSNYLAPQTIMLWKVQDIDFCMQNRCFVKALDLKYCFAIEHGKCAVDVKFLM